MRQLEGKGAVVVAHPDDETLWAGGFIAKHPGVTVICYTVPRRDPERSLLFFEACRSLGAFPILVPIQEPAANEELTHCDVLQLSQYDWILTHNKNGEYGHQHHKDVHQHVMKSTSCPVFVFGYNFESGRGAIVLDLDNGIWERKLTALQCYDHQSPSDGGKPKWRALMDVYQISPDQEVFYAVR